MTSYGSYRVFSKNEMCLSGTMENKSQFGHLYSDIFSNSVRLKKIRVRRSVKHWFWFFFTFLLLLLLFGGIQLSPNRVFRGFPIDTSYPFWSDLLFRSNLLYYIVRVPRLYSAFCMARWQRHVVICVNVHTFYERWRKKKTVFQSNETILIYTQIYMCIIYLYNICFHSFIDSILVADLLFSIWKWLEKRKTQRRLPFATFCVLKSVNFSACLQALRTQHDCNLLILNRVRFDDQ